MVRVYCMLVGGGAYVVTVLVIDTGRSLAHVLCMQVHHIQCMGTASEPLYIRQEVAVAFRAALNPPHPQRQTTFYRHRLYHFVKQNRDVLSL